MTPSHREVLSALSGLSNIEGQDLSRPALPAPTVPEYKRKQRELAKVPRGRVMHNHSIAAYVEKTGKTAISARVINASFAKGPQSPESK